MRTASRISIERYSAIYVILAVIIPSLAFKNPTTTRWQQERYYRIQISNRQSQLAGRTLFRWALSSSKERTESESFLLPVFPLRKSVRLPTDRMELNLYEPRYLALSEYVLREELPSKFSSMSPDDMSGVFGALYASDKPQMVRGGVEPVVPMLSEGDIGVLCHVDSWKDGMIPARGGSTRRRIRLEATAVSRFQVDRVVCDGAGGTCESSELSKQPFVIVEARFVRDDHMEESSVEAFEKDLNGSDPEVSKTVEQAASILDKSRFRRLYGDGQGQQLELLSFALASKQASNSPTKWAPKDMQFMLRTFSTLDRVKLVLEHGAMKLL